MPGRSGDFEECVSSEEQSLPLAMLDFVGIEYGETAASSIAGAVGIAQTVEAAGYRRYWVSEHHNMRSLACSAPELLAFGSQDPEQVLTFEAAWTMIMRNLRRGIREPLRPETVHEFARSSEFLSARGNDERIVTGEPKAVAERLLELKDQSEADEIVVVTPALDREVRKASYRAIADAWRQVA